MNSKSQNKALSSNEALLIASAIGIATGCIGLIASSSPIAYYICALYLTIFGSAATLTCLTKPNNHSLALLLGGSLAFAYGFGTLNTEFRYISNDTDLLKLSFITREDLTFATALILISTCTLSAIGSAIKYNITTPETFRSITNNGAIVFGALTIITCIALIATGQIGFNLSFKSDQGGPSPIAQLALALIVPASGILSAKINDQTKNNKIITVTLIAACLGIQLMMGRRVFLFTGLACVACYFSTNQHTRLLTKRNIAIAALAIPTLLIASKAFLAMRFASWQLPENTRVSVIVTEAIEILKNSDRSDIDHKAEENEQTRTFVIGYFAELLSREKISGPLYGELLKFSTALMVPSSIWSGKSKFIALGFEETIIHPHFGLPVWDGANSLLTTGLCDFGIAGVLIYPLVIGVFLSITPRILESAFKRRLQTLPMSIGLIYVTLSIESALAAYLTSTRDLVFICIVFTTILIATNKLRPTR